MEVKNSAVTKHMRAVVPQMILDLFVENQTLLEIATISLTIFLIHGPVFGPDADSNALRFLLAPILCPWIPAMLFFVKPINPYDGPYARMSGMLNLDATNTEARRLRELFRSAQARSNLAYTSLRLSGILLVLMSLIMLISVVSGMPLTWTIDSRWSGPGYVGGTMGCLLSILTAHIPWGINTWAKGDAA